MNKKRDKMAEECKDAYFNGEGYGSQTSVQRPDLSFKAGWDACEKESAMEIADLVKMLEQKQLFIGAMDLKLIRLGVNFDFEQALAKLGDKK